MAAPPSSTDVGSTGTTSAPDGARVARAPSRVLETPALLAASDTGRVSPPEPVEAPMWTPKSTVVAADGEPGVETLGSLKPWLELKVSSEW